MSEMEWEEPPEVVVPLVRSDWLNSAFDGWTRGCFPPRRGVFIAWGCLLPIWGAFILLKLGIYAVGLLALIAAFLLWIPVDLLTYRRRRKRAVLDKWGPYMGELHGETP